MSKEEFADYRNQIIDLITPLVERHNKLLHENYRIEKDDHLTWISIHSDSRSFNGCLLKDLAMLSDVYSWSFGVFLDSKGLYVVL